VALLMLLGSVTIAAAAPGTASAGPPPSFFGVIPGELPSAEEFARMGEGHIGAARIGIYQGTVEPKPGLRDWSIYDEVVLTSARAGVRIAPVLFGSPQWMNEKPATMPIYGTAQEISWSTFVTDAARRYGPGGHFWVAHPELRYLPMFQWEVWNEPNISEYTGGQPASPRHYARLLTIADQALAAANPQNQVVLAGLYRRPRRGYGIPMTRFLESLYRIKGLQKRFDAVAIHPYAARPPQVLKVLNRARRIMASHRDARKPMLITEIGWTTGGPHWASSPYRTTLATQATRLREVFRLLIKNRRKLHLEQVMWHTWLDVVKVPDFWVHHMGLFTVDGQPKPAWRALLGITGGTGTGKINELGIKTLPPGPGPAPQGGS
jgi:hypothetical protein